MTDRERLNEILAKLGTLDGLNPEAYGTIAEGLDRTAQRRGYDAQGRMEVAFFDAKSYDIESFDRVNQGRYGLRYLSTPLSLETVPAVANAKAVCLFVNDAAGAPVIRRLAAAGVELIALRCAGYNNVDIKACADCGISLVRVPAYSPHAVAEHTVALMLVLNRQLHRAYLRSRAGAFVLEGLTGFDMYGKTAGVVGTGKIGQCVIAILRGFGCRVLAFDRFEDEAVSALEGVEYAPLERVLRESDILTLHVPLFPETHHLINRHTIALMKDGAMLINTSRGGLVDTAALIAALKTGKIGSAGLDVYEEEAGVFFHDMSSKVLTDDILARLLTFNNVVVTSHQGFLTREALHNIAATTVENLAEWETGKRGAALTNGVRTG